MALERAIFDKTKFFGGHSEGVTPVPIPNTAVKPLAGRGPDKVARAWTGPDQDPTGRLKPRSAQIEQSPWAKNSPKGFRD